MQRKINKTAKAFTFAVLVKIFTKIILYFEEQSRARGDVLIVHNDVVHNTIEHAVCVAGDGSRGRCPVIDRTAILPSCRCVTAVCI